MNRRGMTLVELMVCVATLSLSGLLFDAISNISERRALEELQRARAEVFAGELIRAAATGKPLDAATRAKLEDGLPGVEVRELQFIDGNAPTPNAVTFLVSWKSRSGTPLEVALTGLRKPGAP
ncbi:MAG: prepilin-type N-terminal cleavage/methylation domain-containing protein [Archangium sp.]